MTRRCAARHRPSTSADDGVSSGWPAYRERVHGVHGAAEQVLGCDRAILRAWTDGCNMAKRKLDPIVYRYNHDPDYKAGWDGAEESHTTPP